MDRAAWVMFWQLLSRQACSNGVTCLRDLLEACLQQCYGMIGTTSAWSLHILMVHSKGHHSAAKGPLQCR
eukprot:1159723-Pelagomonas_calceolata.AAC.3